MGKYLFRKENFIKGFTLLETLIAVSILSMIIVSLFAGFSLGLKGWKQINEKGMVNQKAMSSVAKIERDLKNSIYYSPIRFEGEINKISFMTIKKNDDKSMLSYMCYWLDNGILKCREDNLVEGKTVEIEMLKDIADLRFEYAIGDENIGYSWISLFKPQRGLPRAVKIVVTIKENETDRTLERIIEIPVGGWES